MTMRKFQLILPALLMFHFSCEEYVDTSPEINYQQASEVFDGMFEGAFSATDSLKILSVASASHHQMVLKLEVENISKAMKDRIANHFDISKSIQQIGIKQHYPVPLHSSKFQKDNIVESLNNIIDTTRAFNDIQKTYIKKFSNDILAVQEYSEGFELVTVFNQKITNTKELTDTEKLILLQFASGTNSLLNFMNNDGVDKMQESVTAIIGSYIPYGRALSCSVDWRDVWSGAVIGLVSGAVYGGYLGATVGTVTVPVLGTAVGAVGGAVFSGAVGFTSGAVSGIASSLLTSCFRNNTLQQSYSSCEEAWEAYLNFQTSVFPSDCLTIPVSLSIK